MRLIQLITGLALALGLLPLSGHAADTVSIQALLISASNRNGEADPRLAAYDSTLRRNLPLNTFRLSGEGTTAVAGGGKSSISLGRGHRLEIQGAKGGGSGIQLKVEWMHDKKTVISTTLTLQPGVPAVLGRRGDDEGEVPVVLLIAK